MVAARVFYPLPLYVSVLVYRRIESRHASEVSKFLEGFNMFYPYSPRPSTFLLTTPHFDLFSSLRNHSLLHSLLEGLMRPDELAAE